MHTIKEGPQIIEFINSYEVVVAVDGGLILIPEGNPLNSGREISGSFTLAHGIGP